MISVIIPSYNREMLIMRAVRSALSQTYSNIEVIVVDDGSSDNTGKVLQNIDDPRFRYIYQEHKNGNAARNRGIIEAKGEYIALLDSDDCWHTDKLQKQLDVLLARNCDLCFCDLTRYIKEKNPTYLKTINETEGIIAYSKIINTAIYPQTILAKRTLFLNEMFDEDCLRMQGYEWEVRALRNAKIFYKSETLADYYVQDDSISSRGAQNRINAAKYIFDKNKSDTSKDGCRIRAYLLKIIISDKIRIGQKPYKEAAELLRNQKTFKNLIRLLLVLTGRTKSIIG